MKKKLLITNCKLFDSLENQTTVDILVENGTIKKIGKIKKDTNENQILDAEGNIVAPGFIDVHIQGAGGVDVLDAQVESLQTISRTCARFGTTSFLATTVYLVNGDNRHLAVVKECVGADLGGANLLGTHIEGPFISLEKKGMILPSCICPPSDEILEDIQKLTNNSLRLMTIAPELEGNLNIIRALVDQGIIASFGHSNASYEETLTGIDAGISHVTHLFNAMPSIHHRHPGPLIAIFESDNVSVQIIPDGVHLHPRILNWVFHLLGEDRCIMITDGMQAIGLPDGKYVYHGIEYFAKNGTARYIDNTLIGTALGISQLLARLKNITNCSFESAIKTVTENPARLLGIEDRKGSITIGKDADLVILGDDFSVLTTIVGGQIVFSAAESE